MGSTNAAAAMAALLAGILVALALAAGPSDRVRSQQTLDDPGSQGLQAGYAVRGQAWAAELFGRRYGRHLLAAVTADRRDGEAAA